MGDEDDEEDAERLRRRRVAEQERWATRVAEEEADLVDSDSEHEMDFGSLEAAEVQSDEESEESGVDDEDRFERETIEREKQRVAIDSDDKHKQSHYARLEYVLGREGGERQ